MKFFLQIVLPVLLAAVGILLAVALFDGSLTGWVLLPVGYFAVLAGFEMTATLALTARGGVSGRRRKRVLCAWWCACAGCIPFAALLLTMAVQNAAFAYPEDLRTKLEAYKTSSGRYPATLFEVDPLDLRRCLVQYHSDGLQFEYTLRTKELLPVLWVYDSKTRAWFCESS